ncbi:MAG: DUF1302 domain-containing protein [Stenotrophobium sp.]
MAGFLGTQALPAEAFHFDLGSGFSGALDSTVSYGLEMRTQKRSCSLIGQDNGGCASLTAALPEASEDAYFLNADDGDLNYNDHDLFSEVVKGTHELLLKMPDGFTFFGRVSELYDWRIGQTARTPLSSGARPYSVYNFDPLDLYINKDFDWFGRSARIRIGNQVMSWGEDIFILGGINSINAIDVRRYHVAGAQVKEFLRPAPMISLSTDITSQVSMETYWQWRWNSFLLDPDGTYFSSADPAGKGNAGAIYLPTSAINAGLAANSLAQPLLALGAIRLAPPGTVGDPGGTGLTAAQLRDPNYVKPRLISGFTNPNFLGTTILPAPLNGLGALTSQQIATLLVDQAFNSGTAIPLVSDKGGSNSGQYGVAFRYHPDWLDASFGLYYERFNSKIPFITYTVNAAYATDNPVSAGYKIEYPSGINLFGVSYNTNAGAWALGGEVSYRPNDPVAIDPSVPSGNDPKSAPYACVTGGGEAAGKYCKGWVNLAKIQLQQSALQIFDPSSSFGGLVLNTLNAKEGYFLGEVGLVDYPGLNRLGGIPWSLPAYAVPDKFSAGYTLETQVTYPNVMNLGFDWLPQIDWSQGVLGNTPNALPWQQGAKSATFTLNFNRHNIITAAIAYSWFFGGGTQNQTSDRDYASFTVGYNF